MGRQELLAMLVEAIQDIQEISGDPYPENLGDEDADHRLGEISNFDSMRGAEVSSRLSGEIGCEIEDLISLFDPNSYEGVSHYEEIVVSQVLDHLDELVSKS